MKAIHCKTFTGNIISIFEIRQDHQSVFAPSWHAYVSINGRKPGWYPVSVTQHGRHYVRIGKDKMFLDDFSRKIA